MASGKNPDNNNLSQRELEILELVATGLTNNDIADKLEISKRTVDNHISNILTKTKTDNRVELVRWALQWGKICLDEVNCCTLPEYLSSE
ncbi:transcriptional regulator, LuxR family [Cyanobacterium stanieri PCC 7202]|uniref:Transcriptional regulator, LuxR family n=1 Tax=Cyanobacterium stanieri (strain ATCC 29140 / PCC 7202) TaxID=292563 RepID=K9YHA0_CYASC|nr:transcriptional regulator, LuxR family [Cyanobacterium stanieri PCC 7202]